VVIALVALAAARSAFAADLSVKAPLIEPPISPWEGYYVGANAGYSRAADDFTAAGGFGVNGVIVPGASFAQLRPSGAFGGAQAGVNWQSSYWVYGLEADFQLSGERDSITSTSSVTSAACFGDSNIPCSISKATGTGTVASELDWFGTLRGRLGIATDQFFFYGTGGLAYGQVKYSGAASFTGTFTDATSCMAGCPASGSAAFADSRIGIGWTLGAGAEGIIPFVSNWTWRAEYLFVDLGRVGQTTTYRSSISVPAIPLTQTVSPTFSHGAVVMDQVVRLGVNYKFGGERPIVTKD
jgi:outer membrane immunogenic protein